jgi:hypothetical protein
MPIKITENKISFERYELVFGKTSGEDSVYIRDKVTGGSGNFKALRFQATDPSPMIGTVAGFTAGGWNPGIPSSDATIRRFTFANESTISNVGSLLNGHSGHVGQCSQTHGYAFGGYPSNVNIDKYPFSAAVPITSIVSGVSNTWGRYSASGNSSVTNGYSSGGSNQFPVRGDREKINFASDGNGVGSGNLTLARLSAAGISSREFGYNIGGNHYNGTMYTRMDRFPFASDADSVLIGEQTSALLSGGISGETHGYTAGGTTSYGYNATNTIGKFPYASEIFNLTQSPTFTISSARGVAATQNSETHGYAFAGGSTGSLDRFPFASDSPATIVSTQASDIAGAGVQD